MEIEKNWKKFQREIGIDIENHNIFCPKTFYFNFKNG